MRYVIKVAYDGTAYGGWQIQNNSVTVQEKLTQALNNVIGGGVTVKASGRTDAGVHAAGQICHFDAMTTIPPEKIADTLLMPTILQEQRVSLAKLAPAAVALRHLPHTPQCASPGGFLFYRKIQRSFL